MPINLNTIGLRAWRGTGGIYSERDQGIKILGVPIGSPDFVVSELKKVLEEQSKLLEKIPLIQDTQSAWTLLLFSGNARANYFNRVLSPSDSAEYCVGHDKN